MLCLVYLHDDVWSYNCVFEFKQLIVTVAGWSVKCSCLSAAFVLLFCNFLPRDWKIKIYGLSCDKITRYYKSIILLLRVNYIVITKKILINGILKTQRANSIIALFPYCMILNIVYKLQVSFFFISSVMQIPHSVLQFLYVKTIY